ncbi:MAG: FAH family protein [Alphaproteobacteria bacterium]|nr:FAH family protein [Alphaproteobacteria bacterium]MDE2339522.1 FAH family protein [Alphaproteobacteria bacterium]
MIRSLIQYVAGGQRAVAGLDARASWRIIQGIASTYELALAASMAGSTLVMEATERLGGQVDINRVRLLAPVDHPDPAHCMVTGTGLTHLGSAAQRDAMHKTAASTHVTDTMRMFQMGVEHGKPAPGEVGIMPEWFYKGDGSSLVACNAPIELPGFAGDGGEEPEIAGIYIIGADGTPFRLGFALGNEFSDHVTERVNYLWLAPSKLRQAGLGPELRLGDLPAEINGMSRIRRGEDVLWERAFLSGESHMSHTIANLEHHHFKYPQFRRPGDVHVHFFGTATLSFSDGIGAQPGDEFEIEADAFHLPLRNTLVAGPEDRLWQVTAL